MNEFDRLGRVAKMLLDLRLVDPSTYPNGWVVEKLLFNYGKSGFAPGVLNEASGLVKAEHWGTDWQGNEVLTGDHILHDPQQDEVILVTDLITYLKEKYGFELKIAE